MSDYPINHSCKPTIKGLCIRLTRLALVLACFVNVLLLFIHHRTLSPGGRILAALGTASLVALVLKRDQFLPIQD